MVKSHPEPSGAALDDLIIRVLSEQATPYEVERVGQWRAESPANETYFRETQGVWQLTEPVGRAAYTNPPSADVITGEPGGAGSVVPMRARRRRRGLATLAAAATVAAVAIGVQILGRAGPGSQPIATFAAVDGSPITVTLQDGSIVRLASGSRLEQWAVDGERRFVLAGRAFFAVRHDPERPFVVEAGGTQARVLGTRFELAEGGGALRTLVLDGRVAVSNDRGRVEVPAGSVASADPEAAPSVRIVEDLYALLDWPGGLLVFQGTPLFRAAEEVSRHFGKSVDVRGDELRALRVTAFFEEEGFEEVVQALCDVSGARCSLTDSGGLIEAGR